MTRAPGLLACDCGADAKRFKLEGLGMDQYRVGCSGVICKASTAWCGDPATADAAWSRNRPTAPASADVAAVERAHDHAIAMHAYIGTNPTDAKRKVYLDAESDFRAALTAALADRDEAAEDLHACREDRMQQDATIHAITQQLSEARAALKPFAEAWLRGVREKGEQNIKKYVEAEDFEAAFHALNQQESSNAASQQTEAQPATAAVHTQTGSPEAETAAENIVKRWAAHTGIMEDERIFVCGNMDELVRDIAAALLAKLPAIGGDNGQSL